MYRPREIPAVASNPIVQLLSGFICYPKTVLDRSSSDIEQLGPWMGWNEVDDTPRPLPPELVSSPLHKPEGSPDST